MDATKLGIATARAMDQLEKFALNGDIAQDGYIGAVAIVVALDSKTSDDEPDRELLRDITTQVFVFAEPEEVYVQEGLLRMGLFNYSPTNLEDD